MQTGHSAGWVVDTLGAFVRDFVCQGKEDKIGLADLVRPWSGSSEGRSGGLIDLSDWVIVGDLNVVVAQDSAIAVVGTVLVVVGIEMNDEGSLGCFVDLTGRVKVGGNTDSNGRAMVGGRADLTHAGNKTALVRGACRVLCSRPGDASSWEGSTIGPDFEGAIGLGFDTGQASPTV